MNSMRERPTNADLALPPPPRLLLWLVLVLLLLGLFGLALGILYVTNGQRFVPLLLPAAVGAALIALISLVLAAFMRGGLPRRFVPALLLVYILLGIAGGIGAVAVYRSLLPPRYQEEIGTLLPFMRAFLPPTPVGGIVPTVAPQTGGISAEDLLNMTIGATPTDAAPSVIVTDEPTPPPTDVPTATPTDAPTQTPIPASPTAPPTEIAAVPTTAPPLPTRDPAFASTPALPFTRRAAERMYGFTHVQQTWNNCGPANVTMALSFFGWREPQETAARFLKPDPEDKNVNPIELVNFVNTQTQVRAVTRIGGTMDLLKNLIAANFPIIIETAYFPQGYDWIGHYQTVVGYDDVQRIFFIYDSFLGAGENGEGIAKPYDQFDREWRDFNRVFIVLYEPAREGLVQQILGERADPQRAAELALDVALAEARANPRDLFAWFNVGTSMTRLGRYEEAAAAYDRARQLGMPFRMLWYQFGPFEAYFNVGRYSDVLSLVDTNLTNGAQYVEETHYWQGRVFQAQGNLAAATRSFNQALAHNPRFEAARNALATLNA